MKPYLLMLCLVALCSCQKPDDLQICYTCTSSVTYKTSSPTYKVPAPYTFTTPTCDQQERISLERKYEVSEPLSGTYKLTKVVQTVCRPTK